MGMEIKENFSPLDGMLNVREFGTPWFLFLKSLSNAIIMPFGVCICESWMSMTLDKACPITQSKSTELSAKLPFMLEVFDCLFGFFV